MHQGTLFRAGAKSYCRYYRKPTKWQAWLHRLLTFTLVYNCFGNLPQSARPWHSSFLVMTHFPQPNASQRSPRVQLNGSVGAAIIVEGGQRAVAKLQSISVTGGLLQLQRALSTGDFVEIAFQTQSGAVHGMAEMLQPVRKFQSACLQPFRFIALGDDDHHRLCMALDCAFDRSLLDPVTDRVKTPQGL
jgi:hypothetical protein